jgi:hypothetical protein
MPQLSEQLRTMATKTRSFTSLLMPPVIIGIDE